MDKEMRLQKFLAMANVASRRASEKLILEGRVSVNGNKVTLLGTKVKDDDIVLVDGKQIKILTKKYYIMLNKPTGYVTTAKDEMGRSTVFDLTCEIKDRLFPVGRLDADTEGLLILTNDGDFTYKVTHPSHELKKTYLVQVKGIPDKKQMEMLRRGIIIDGKMTSPAEAQIIETTQNSALLEIKIHEGRNRQVRKMMDGIGHGVIALKRTAIGSVVLGNLPLGKWRHLRPAEIEVLGGKTND